MRAPARRSTRPGAAASSRDLRRRTGPLGGRSPDGSDTRAARLPGPDSAIHAGFRKGLSALLLLARGRAAQARVADRRYVRHTRATRGEPTRRRGWSRFTGPGAAQTATSDATGEFHFLGLSPGEYCRGAGADRIRDGPPRTSRWRSGNVVLVGRDAGRRDRGDTVTVDRRLHPASTIARSKRARHSTGRSSKTFPRHGIPGGSSGRSPEC